MPKSGNAPTSGVINKIGAMTAGMTDEVRKKLIEMTPAGRIGRPEDVAAAVVYLASAEAAWVTGQVLGVNGGLRM